jgi:FkbM family methyltransferase
VEVWGSDFVPPTLDRQVALQAHRLGLMGTQERLFFQKFVRPDWHIADVGANQGLYTILLSGLASKGRLYAFEPDPGLFVALKGNIQRNCTGNAMLFNAAAASRPSKLLLRPGRLNRGDNRIVQPGNGSTETIEVAAVTLDEVILDHRVDLLKIDVQGFEFDVLRGAHQIIRANPNLLILFEFWPHGLTLAGASPEELLNFLRENGFSLFRFNRDLKFQPFVYNSTTWSRLDQFCNLVAIRDLGRLNEDNLP